ncbi:MAG: hypothetical protein M1815_005934 [Lichina confinis]|nr:MAG: hypothetical protein M1815_005934 [Lichina confinis]
MLTATTPFLSGGGFGGGAGFAQRSGGGLASGGGGLASSGVAGSDVDALVGGVSLVGGGGSFSGGLTLTPRPTLVSPSALQRAIGLPKEGLELAWRGGDSADDNALVVSSDPRTDAGIDGGRGLATSEAGLH